MPGPSHTSSSNRQVGHDEWLCIHARMHGSWYRWPHGSRSAPSATGSWQMAQAGSAAKISRTGDFPAPIVPSTQTNIPLEMGANREAERPPREKEKREGRGKGTALGAAHIAPRAPR